MPENYALALRPTHFQSLFLFVLTLGNYALMYMANIVLARALTLSDFDDYSVALSTVTMLSTLATLGLEKYALRGIALFRERQDWRKFRGFWLFSLRIISIFSVLLVGLLSVSLETLLAIQQADYHIAIVLFAGFLPIIAITLFLVEVISAQGAHLLGFSLYRLFLPLVYLLLITGYSASHIPLTASAAVLCFGVAWTLTCGVIWYAAKLLMPIQVKHATALSLPKKWLGRSLPLVFNSLMLTVMTSSGVVILELLFPSGLEVGIYAVAAQTGGFISLIGTSTNRYYLPMMVVLVEHKDKAGIQRLIKQRTLVVGSLILSLFTLIALFGPQLLSLFGSQFSSGYLTLVIIATGASFSALFADIPYYLQFMGFNRIVLGSTLIAAVTMVTLAFYLGNLFGTVGVAIAYMLPAALLFSSFRIMVSVHFRRF
ncbi:Polysaccharide biosynthesis protein [Crenothrix polyspora]|uniref:Polysaccharide biosynthesis protein n=1 Tax=Crenothrix polyspora TaxID=360316 RepID=A0A1R4HAI5_9GAMM|nr:oligosaccharide flippase family protein [Crenothrix polyspora]SJM93041.1 Polysaccharide biosynthesis protein [Crenothrix polyspora]